MAILYDSGTLSLTPPNVTTVTITSGAFPRPYTVYLAVTGSGAIGSVAVDHSFSASGPWAASSDLGSILSYMLGLTTKAFVSDAPVERLRLKITPGASSTTAKVVVTG